MITHKRWHPMMFFLLIGICSTLVHLSVVFLLVNAQVVRPILANIAGFLLAFNVSFVGHKCLTFSHLANQAVLRLPRFFLVAVWGAFINEGLYALFLAYTTFNYLVSLVFVIALVAVMTYLLSRYFACR